jgi:hypothetical protein
MPRRYMDPNEPLDRFDLPVVDNNDAELVGWEAFEGPDGAMYIQHWCSHCDEAAWLRIPAGAIILHTQGGHKLIEGITFGGNMKEAPKDIVPPKDTTE